MNMKVLFTQLPGTGIALYRLSPATPERTKNGIFYNTVLQYVTLEVLNAGILLPPKNCQQDPSTTHGDFMVWCLGRTLHTRFWY